MGSEQLVGVDLGIVQVPACAIAGEAVWCQRPKAPSLLSPLVAHLGHLLRPKAEAVDVPVSLFKIANRYYVRRGHQQVRDAKRRRQLELPARVVDYVEMSGDVTGLLQRAHAEFARRSGISEVRLSAPENYGLLLAQITEHRKYLEQSKGQLFMPSDVIVDWLQRLYRPVTDGMLRDGVFAELPGISAGDAYMQLATFLEKRAVEKGLSLSEAMEHVISLPTSWRIKMADVLPPCMIEGLCPYVSPHR